MNEYIASRYNQFLLDLEAAVSIDSASEYLDGVADVARFFQQRFDALGMETRLEYVGERGVPCLSARNRPDTDTCDVMLLGHMDTVFPKGEAAKRPFAIVGDKATGPGTCDMKGGLVAILHAVEALHHAGHLDKLSVQVAFNGDEEVGSAHSRPWIEATAAKCKRVLVFEPCRPGYRFVLRRKGAGWFYVDCHGKAAHAGADPDNGANAVLGLAKMVELITARSDREKGTGINVTMFRGGDKLNILPDHAQIGVDVRVAQQDELEPVNQFFASLDGMEPIQGVRASVSGHMDRGPMEPNENTMRLWKQLTEEADRIGFTPEYIATGGGSDGNLTSALGIPTIDGMGPVGAHSHCVEEYVDTTTIVPMVQLAANLCLRLAQE